MTPVFGASFKDNFEPHGDVGGTYICAHTYIAVCVHI